MAGQTLSVVTGAYGFTGKYIAERLLAQGETVRTITGHPQRPSPFEARVEARPFDFDRPERLAESLRGARTLYNTYWIRFQYGQSTFQQAVDNTRTMIAAAKEAGVQKIVHISISNASVDSPLPYFRGKALVEQAVRESGLSYAIIRPTVMFGSEGILINNIAWLLRNLPVFAVAGNGKYRLQPVYVGDVADLAVRSGQESSDSTLDAAGPEVYSYNALVRAVRAAAGSRSLIIHLRPRTVLRLAGLVGKFVNDVVLTSDEVLGLMGNLLVSNGEPTGPTLLSTWLENNARLVGAKYQSELARHYSAKS